MWLDQSLSYVDKTQNQLKLIGVLLVLRGFNMFSMQLNAWNPIYVQLNENLHWFWWDLDHDISTWKIKLLEAKDNFCLMYSFCLFIQCQIPGHSLILFVYLFASISMLPVLMFVIVIIYLALELHLLLLYQWVSRCSWNIGSVNIDSESN